MTKRSVLLLTVVLLISVIASACGTKPAATNEGATQGSGSAPAAQDTGKLAEIKKAGKIIMATSADYPPYEFHKMVDGKDQIVGFDIEVAKAIAKDLGVELEIKDIKFDGLLAALQGGQVDMVIAGMTPTPEREKNVDFTKVYYTAVQGIVVRAEDKDKYKSLEDFKPLTIGVQKGSIQEQVATEQIPGAKLKQLSKIPDLMQELKNKKVDAVIAEIPVANSFISKNKELVLSVVKTNAEEAGSAVAFKKGSGKLVEEVNKTIERLIAEKKIEQFVTDANLLVE